jgi:hypothetical protein
MHAAEGPTLMLVVAAEQQHGRSYLCRCLPPRCGLPSGLRGGGSLRAWASADAPAAAAGAAGLCGDALGFT